MSEKILRSAFRNLRSGFILSTISIVLFDVYLFNFGFFWFLATNQFLGYALITFFVWSCGLLLRQKGWRLLGQKSTADLMFAGWLVIPFLLLGINISFFWLVLFYYVWIFWVFYTLFEAHEFFLLDRKYCVGLSKLRFLNIVSIVAISVLVAFKLAPALASKFAFPIASLPLVISCLISINAFNKAQADMTDSQEANENVSP